MKEYVYTVVYQKDERGVWTAHVPVLNNLASEGDSLDEAKQMIEEAIKLYIECLDEENSPIPSESKSGGPLMGTVAVAV